MTACGFSRKYAVRMKSIMKAEKTIAIYRRLRTQPLWRLLAADNGPTILGLLQTQLYDNERSLPASIFHERIGRELETLRAQGDNFPQTAQAYVADWLTNGYLERRFPANATEEEYELSSPAVQAIRFVSNLVQPYSAATESRLTLLIEAIARLAEDTDTDKFRRIDRLMEEQKRIDEEIDAINKGQMRVLARTTALERTREIIMLADGLAGDFRGVRDEFERLNRDLRERIIENDSNRGEVLDSLFANIDLIAESDAGRTFEAFWRLLTDPEQTAILDQALDDVMSRGFVTELNVKERRFLLRLTRTLLEQGGTVHDVSRNFARSLKHFVQSREYLEQRRLNRLLNDAQRAALTIKDEIKATDNLQYDLQLTSCRISSVSRLSLHDPTAQAIPEQMEAGSTSSASLTSLSALVAQSEIDFRTLKANIQTVLEQKSQASIADVLMQFPATQGLGTIVGMLVLGSKHGYKIMQRETVTWLGSDKQQRSAHIPKIFFLREKMHEL